MGQTISDEKLNSTLLEDDDEAGYTPYNKRPETFIVPVLFAFIYIVGVLGNGTLVIIFLRHRSMRNIPNTYIFSLALADLLVILVCVPTSGVIYTFEEWIWGETMCRITEFGKDVFYGVSVFTLTALAAERYCAIVNPLRKLQTKPLTVITAILIWVLAVVCATPAAIVSNLVDLPVKNRTTNWTIVTCQPYGDPLQESTPIYAKYNVICKAIIYYILPLSIIGVLYVLMARRLHVSARDMPGEIAGPQSRAQARARRHVARMVVTFVLVFIVCFLPQHIFNLWFHCNPNSRDEYDHFWHILRIVGFSLSFLNSCVNPIALYCVSGVFRQHFHRYLCCKTPTPTKRLGMSTASGADTTYMSTIRRNNQSNNNTVQSHNGGSPAHSIVIAEKR
ncbi:hypothetical protein HA402_006070 [Bradysia odoriphaga]|nr:hypothetical protein HA402_006070 [Bradysia odoriphaga]